MKIKLLRQLYIMSRIAFHGLLIQLVIAGILMASDSKAQFDNKSIENINISIKAQDIPLKNVLEKIGQKTGFAFTYNDKVIDANQHVSVSARNGSLANVLRTISQKTHLKFRRINDYIHVAQMEMDEAPIKEKIDMEQGVEVSGKVTSSEDDEGLPGVNVIVKGTSQGTVTDVEGNYKINAPSDQTILVFSSVGYVAQEVTVGNKTVIDLSLVPDIKALQEIVVVGYGTQKKSVVTGSISSVKSSDLENQQIGRLESALQGRASGLTIASSSGAPGSEATVRIRGTTSLNEGASNPLYVVDGVVVGNGGIDYLNPSDIESIEVLKDAASAAIYGARSSAGVILVTTKKGKSGGIQVNYNGYYGTQSPAKRLDLLNANQYATLINEQYVNGGKAPLFADPNAFGQGTDWQSVIFNNDARIQNHELSVSGGNDVSNFYSSFGYFDQEGIVATDISDYKRYNIRLNATHKIASWLTFGEKMGYSHINKKIGVPGNQESGAAPPLIAAINLDPVTPVVITDPDVANSVPYSTQPVVRDAQGRPYGISPYTNMINPAAYIQTEDGNYNWSDNIVGSVFLEAEPIKGLKFRSNVGTSLSYWGSENFTPIAYFTANNQNSQTSFARNRQKSLNWNLENTISYSHDIDQHHFTILLGQGAYLDNNSSGVNVTYFNIPVTNFHDASMNYSLSSDDITASGNEGIHHTVSSLFSRVTYDYAGKYLVTGVIRRDGSSRFGSNNKYGYFPGASLGWVASQEDFWSVKDVLSFFKFRASYGVTGNDVLGDFRYLSTVGGGRNYTFGDDIYSIGYSPDAPANPDLKWEQTTQLDFGFDAVLFQDWSLAFDWYNKKTTGILQVVTLPGYVGATGSSYGNVADMVNKGMELELGYDKQLGEININVKGNVSYVKNEVTYLGEDKAYLEGGGLQSSLYELTRTAVGQPIGALFGFKTQGIFQNQQEIDNYTGPGGNPIQPNATPGDFRWADTNNDGQITEADRTFIGNPLPDWSYGFTLNASWKNFDLLVFGQGVSGNEIFQALRRLDHPNSNWQSKALDRLAW